MIQSNHDVKTSTIPAPMTAVEPRRWPMHYYQDPVQTKRIYISPISLEDTGMTYLGFYSNPDRRMVLAALFPDEEGMSFEEI